MAREVIWVMDTSSVIAVRRSIENPRKPVVFASLGALAQEGRLVYPKQVVDELERAADPQSPDAQYQWAKQNEAKASERTPSLDEVKEVLNNVPTVLDPDKDMGVEEADPYVLAVAVRLRAEGKEARVITENQRTFRGKCRSGRQLVSLECPQCR